MKAEFSKVEAKGLFCTTKWSLIARSADIRTPESQTALAELCTLYWYSLYAFARRSGHDVHTAEDLTQGFFLHLLEHKTFDQVNRAKGRFRSFLLASFKHYMSVVWHRNHAAKRGGCEKIVSLDAENAEHRYGLEAVDDLTADKVFEARWAETLLARTTNRLRDDYIKAGKERIFSRLQMFLLHAGSEEENSYQSIAEEFGLTASGAKTLIFRLRKRFAALLREEVANTLMDPADVESELHALCEALLTAQPASVD